MAGKTFRMPAIAPSPKFVAPAIEFTSGGEGSDVFYQMEGMEALIANLDLLPPWLKDVAGYELANIAADVITDAKDNFVPYRYGALHDSGDSDEYIPNQLNNLAEIGMWFGGMGAAGGPGAAGRTVGHATRSGAVAQDIGLRDPSAYAEIQHEDTSFEHPVVGPVTAPQDHYLETPFLNMVPQILPRISQALGTAMDMNPAFLALALSGKE